jgi:hypothetical protein
VTINTDITKTRALKELLRSQKVALLGWTTDDPRLEGLQPEDLNTDGIDPSGHDVWIHDCTSELIGGLGDSDNGKNDQMITFSTHGRILNA